MVLSLLVGQMYRLYEVEKTFYSFNKKERRTNIYKIQK